MHVRVAPGAEVEIGPGDRGGRVPLGQPIREGMQPQSAQQRRGRDVDPEHPKAGPGPRELDVLHADQPASVEVDDLLVQDVAREQHIVVLELVGADAVPRVRQDHLGRLERADVVPREVAVPLPLGAHSQPEDERVARTEPRDQIVDLADVASRGVDDGRPEVRRRGRARP